MSRAVSARAVAACVVMVATGVVGVVGPASSAPPPASPASPNVASAPPSSATIVINQKSWKQGYVDPNIKLAQGGTLYAENTSSMQHTVTSNATGPYPEGAFFDSGIIGANHTVQIPAVSSLPADTYRFHCNFHRTTMKGTLTIVGSGGSLPTPPSFQQPLKLPPVISSATSTVHIESKAVRVLPKPAPLTNMWTYNGTYPGPTFIRPAGHDTQVTFVNDLGPSLAAADPSDGAFSVHFHGDHHKSSMDGQPDSYLVPPGGSRTYDWPLTDHGNPEPAASFWYHDHRLLQTTRNNYMGLQGMFEVTDGHAAKLGLPTGKYDLPLMVSERSFDANGQLTNVPSYTSMETPSTDPDAPPGDGTIGDHVLVDGRYLPYLGVSTHRYLLRLVNTSPFTSYDFALSNGAPLVQVGTGNSYLPKPIVRGDVLLGPAQRADVIVDFHGDLNKKIELVSRSTNQIAQGTKQAYLMQFRVNSQTKDSTRIPSSLVPTPKINVPSRVAHTWVVDVGNDGAGNKFWTINGQMFDPTQPMARIPLGSTQTWKLVNNSPVTHFIHIHEEQWHTVSRDGGPPYPWERGLQDTWKLNPGEVVKVAAHFTDYVGDFMIHCHMLDHEDHGLMATFEVFKPTTGAAATTTTRRSEAAPTSDATTSGRTDAASLLLSPTATPSASSRDPLLAALSGGTWLATKRGLMCKPDGRRHS